MLTCDAVGPLRRAGDILSVKPSPDAGHPESTSNLIGVVMPTVGATSFHQVKP